MIPRSVYIHIPFCSHKCHYCDFTAYVVGGQPVDEYLDALEEEMIRTVKEIPPETIETIFIGGGTPTVLTPVQLERLMEAIRRRFPDRSEDLEFTVEANPGTLTPEKLAVMKEGGVNRLSIGAQTFRPDLLAKIGRVHSVEDIEQSVEQARAVGIDNISLDLMFGLPEQTVADVEEALQRGLALSPEHFSVYSLKVEEGTVFHHQLLRGKLPLPTEDEELEMYLLTRRRLEEAGFRQYEVSNFCRPGRESRHNTVYWLNLPYYGLGAGAHGYAKGIRHANVRGVGEYIRLVRSRRPVAESHTVFKDEAMENHFLLGLRLLDGVSRKHFSRLYGKEPEKVFGSVLDTLTRRGLICLEGDRYRLTEQGLLFGNEAFASFLGEGA
ncbi:oxygen-independent coproporphyrinogen-3 oxidase [Melghirimyces profundicolus]|uniref:Heme chaperone HemW n=1 Tax=Melghirimyces profundicolus TaxID=1242148 RepID=A0A2T6C954_9BACL|nr:radical SAM family heme chaperone HemW [Melghirimyces profundicolus]PTX64842.1 oxygen-independent coproporphyrinogen-3 oxidase [Melghirimyces profundicolus]